MYDPLVRENEYDVPVIAPEPGRPVIFTYHAVPDVKLDSVNVTMYIDFEKVIGCDVFFPFTVINPAFA